jgi:hypothetical protein
MAPLSTAAGQVERFWRRFESLSEAKTRPNAATLKCQWH